MMWAIVERVYVSSLFRKLPAHMVVKCADVLFRIVPARNTCLIGYHKDEDAGFIESANRLRGRRYPFEVLYPVQVLDFLVQGTIAVEESGLKP
jgi:hypothetical protein